MGVLVPASNFHQRTVSRLRRIRTASQCSLASAWASAYDRFAHDVMSTAIRTFKSHVAEHVSWRADGRRCSLRWPIHNGVRWACTVRLARLDSTSRTGGRALLKLRVVRTGPALEIGLRAPYHL